MNSNSSDQRDYPRDISGEVLFTVPVGTKPPAGLTEFHDLTVDELAEVNDGVRVGVWRKSLTASGLEVLVEMWLRAKGDTLTVSPAYVAPHDDPALLEFDGHHARIFARLLGEAADLAAQAEEEMHAREMERNAFELGRDYERTRLGLPPLPDGGDDGPTGLRVVES